MNKSSIIYKRTLQKNLKFINIIIYTSNYKAIYVKITFILINLFFYI